MDPILATVLLFFAAEVSKGVISGASKDLYDHLKKLIQHKNTDKPDVQQVIESLGSRTSNPSTESILIDVDLNQDQEILQEAQQLFALSPVLRRSHRVGSIFHDARILWVDDHPHYNIYESEVLRSFGVKVDFAQSTSEGISRLRQRKYDLVISDMEREGISNEGLKFLDEMRKQHFYLRTIFYVGGVDLSKGTPPYAFGITDNPDDLLHFVIDILERERG
jgi:CheY-like chemotaxis protein